jgi:hypothetical protein
MSVAADGRTALLEAGRRLAMRHTLAELDPLLLCSEAKVGLDAFEREFASLGEFVAALQQDFMERLREKILAVTSGSAAGLMRLKLATESYLQGCLAERPLRAWLLDARLQADVLEGLRRQNQVYWMILGSEFKSLRWPHPRAAGRIYLAMANEAAQAEHRVGHPLASVRDTLWEFLERGTPAAPPS